MLKNKYVDTIDGIMVVALFCAFWVFFTFMAISAMEDDTLYTRMFALEMVKTLIASAIIGHKIENEED